MKKFALLFCLLFTASLAVPAKAVSLSGPSKGDQFIGAHLGLYGLGLNVAYDYTLAKVGPGAFTIGAYLGWNWNYGGEHFIPIAARTTYRLFLDQKWETYAGFLLGPAPYAHNGGGGCWVAAALVLGGTYYFTDKVGVNLEINAGAWSTSYINFGFHFKL